MCECRDSFRNSSDSRVVPSFFLGLNCSVNLGFLMKLLVPPLVCFASSSFSHHGCSLLPNVDFFLNLFVDRSDSEVLMKFYKFNFLNDKIEQMQITHIVQKLLKVFVVGDRSIAAFGATFARR